MPNAPETWKNKARESVFIAQSFLFYLDGLGHSRTAKQIKFGAVRIREGRRLFAAESAVSQAE